MTQRNAFLNTGVFIGDKYRGILPLSIILSNHDCLVNIVANFIINIRIVFARFRLHHVANHYLEE